MANPLLTDGKPKPVDYTTPFNVADGTAWINATYQNMLGRQGHADGISNLLPVLQNQGQQAVRQRLASSDQYLSRMLDQPGQGPVPAWQQAARQATSNQSMMPGSFWDYTNPLFGDPASASQIMSPADAPGNALLRAIFDPNADWIKALFPKSKEDEEKDKKKAAEDAAATADMNFVDRSRLAYQQSRGRA